MTTNREPTTSEYQPPKLSILHLLFWIAGSSLVLAFCRGMFPSEATLTYDDLLLLCFVLLGAMLLRLSIASLGVTVAEWWQGKRFPVQPGEWMLVLIGIGVPMGIFQLQFSAPNLNLIYVSPAVVVTCIFFQFGYLLLLATAAYSLRKERPWRFAVSALFVAVIFLDFMPLVSDSASLLPFFAIVFSLSLFSFVLAVFIAILSDINRKTDRGWIHWTGVGVWAAMAVWGFVFIAVGAVMSVQSA